MIMPMKPEEYQKLTHLLSNMLDKEVKGLSNIVKGEIKHESLYGRRTMEFELLDEVKNLSDKEIEALAEENSYHFGFSLGRKDDGKIKIKIFTD